MPQLPIFFGFLAQHKYVAIFPIAVVEGPIITLISGFLISLNYLDPAPTFMVVVSGDLISDSFFYVVGRFGRATFERISWFRIPEEKFKKLEERFKAHPMRTIALGKISYGLAGFFLMAAGASKIAYRKFLVYAAPPTALKSFSLLMIGYYSGRAYEYFDVYLGYYGLLVLVVVPLGYALVGYLEERRAKEGSYFPRWPI